MSRPANHPWNHPGRLPQWQDRFVHVLLAAFAGVSILTTAGILVILGTETAEFFRTGTVSPLKFLTGTVMPPQTDHARFGLLPLVWGTLAVAVGACLIALPVGLATAIYLSEYAAARTRAFLKPGLDLLAAVPTIVHGYLALTVVTPALRHVMGLAGVRVDAFNLASAAIVVGIMLIPMVAALSEAVLRAVPQGLREAAYGLGATKFEVATQIVVPAGLSGVLASFAVAFSRAIGETMAVVLAAGRLPGISTNVFSPAQTLTSYLVSAAPAGASPGSPAYGSLFAVGTVLFLLTLCLNSISNSILRRYRERYA